MKPDDNIQTHVFDPNTYSAASPYCAAMVMRDGGGDECGLLRDDPAHAAMLPGTRFVAHVSPYGAAVHEGPQ